MDNANCLIFVLNCFVVRSGFLNSIGRLLNCFVAYSEKTSDFLSLGPLCCKRIVGPFLSEIGIFLTIIELRPCDD